jgi:hypothetical protein
MMKIPGLTITDRDALQQWVDSAEHSYDCAAHSEGLDCCLDKLLEHSEVQ